MEKFMTKEIASGLALDTGEFIPASDLNAQMTAPPVPTSATWGNWREPTTVAQRLGDVLQLLCGGKRPPDDVVLAWLDAEMGDIGLQHFCAQHGPAWAQGIALIELAMVAVAQPTEGVDHEHVAVDPQVELAHAVLANGLTAEETFATASRHGLTEPRPGAAYAALPDGVATLCEYGGDVFTAAQMRAFADATYTIRASHGQAPAMPECLTCNDHGAVGNILTAEPCPDCTRKAAPAAAAGPIGYGPKVTVRRSCSDCEACNSESYAVQGDSGHYVYCEHPSLPESKYIGDTNWNTPHWCPVSEPTTQPAPQQEALEPFAWHVCSVNSDGSLSLEHAAAWEEAAHEHINDAITDHDIEGAGSWVVRPAYHDAPQPSPAAQGDALDAARWRALLACGRIRIIGTAGVTGTGAHDPKALDPNKQPYGNYVHFGAEFWSTFPDQDYYNTKENPAYARATLTEFADAARAEQEKKA